MTVMVQNQRRVKYATDKLNKMSAEEIKEYQELLLQKQLRRAVRNSSYYRNIFKDLGIRPEDILTLEDYRELPVFMNKELERESQRRSLEENGHPFGTHLLCRPDEVAFTGTTSGTSGTPTFTYTYTAQDVQTMNEYIRNMLEYGGIYEGDRLLFSHSLGIYATSSILFGVREHGVLPIDVDVRAGSQMILKYTQLTQPNGAMMTPSLAEHLIDKAPTLIGKGVDSFNLQALFTVGEIGIGIPEIKHKIETAYNCRVYDYLGEIGFSCDSDTYYGIHCVSPDLGLFTEDIVDPETRKPIELKNGVVGEVIMTELRIIGLPRIKYATGDLIEVSTEPCPGCGFTGHRVRVVGRSDDLLIVKGVNVYPSAIKNILTKFPSELTGEFRVVLESPPPRVIPPLLLKIEFASGITESDLHYIEEKVLHALHQKLRITPSIEWCKPGTLEKQLTKTSLFERRY
ncbi:phenylacetate-CoA ligase [Psychrobacillus sp. OK028]|uniref:phenylacetate--CoA ligase family protein n=1 Tax=Psychrobacillus sp. OK028 TaxID=1884359 RepID=UPI0008837F90|nr:phenylacetate--CoA ligase family protein [Psychrobacillus sp. OK028]SDM36988.1 phenylacetate-CoA ligase [Psychrobacillus sp. OK028]